MKPKILAFAGSARKNSFNKKILQHAVKGARSCAGIEVTVIDLKDYPMPLYDGDFEEEQGLPENALKLKELFKNHEGFLIACPEYNSSMTPLLKNTIDWLSRSIPGEAPLACFQGKFAGLLSASPGALGGIRGLPVVRSILGNIGVHVIPHQVAVSKVHEALDETSSIKDEKLRSNLEKVGMDLAHLIKKFHA